MINILLKLFLLISTLTILDVFLPIDYYAFRHWEKFYRPTLHPGSFIPNKHFEGYEFLDRYKSRSKAERSAANKIYTKWITDDLGFRNDKSKSTINNSEVIFVGDSNFVGSSFDQEEIVSEVYMSQAKSKAYTIGYNLRYILTLIENNNSHNIKHLVIESKPSYFSGEYMELVPFYINKECKIFAIHYPHLSTQSNFNLLDYYLNNFKNRPFSKFIRSNLGIYNFPENSYQDNKINSEVVDNQYICNQFNNHHDITIKNDLDDYLKNHIILKSNEDKSMYFQNIMLYLKNYLNSKNIKLTFLLLTHQGDLDDFKDTINQLNKNDKFIYDSSDLIINGDIWQLGDSHWKVEAARNFINILINQ